MSGENGSSLEGAEAQIKYLAKFILEKVEGQPSASEGAGECAVRVIQELQRQIAALSPDPDKIGYIRVGDPFFKSEVRINGRELQVRAIRIEGHIGPKGGDRPKIIIEVDPYDFHSVVDLLPDNFQIRTYNSDGTIEIARPKTESES